MESVSTRLDDETARLVHETADERDDSLSQVLRELVEKGLEYDELERENERLRRERRQILDQREEHQELVRHVEDEREEREHNRERRNAPVWRRAKWWVFGRSENDTEG